MALRAPVPFISNAHRFFSAPGHQALSVSAGAGVVVEQGEGQPVIVEKIDLAGEIAERTYDELAE
jgi:hypothetical protein